MARHTERRGAVQDVLPIYDAGGRESVDIGRSGFPDEQTNLKVSANILQDELSKVLKSGLPLSAKTAGEVLPNLRSVVARSVHPYDPLSRIASLNQLLLRMLAELKDLEYGSAPQELFVAATNVPKPTLTDRRERAAFSLSYEFDHFRKNIEPKILEQFAAVLYEDLLRYKRRIRRAPLAEEPTGDTPGLTTDDLTHQEELISRIWQHVYGWRAELIAMTRLQEQPGYESQAEDHRQAAMRMEQQLRTHISEYVNTYGERLLKHGEAEYDVDAILRLASWSG